MSATTQPRLSESDRELERAARAFIRALDKYEVGLLKWRDVQPFLLSLRRATVARRETCS